MGMNEVDESFTALTVDADSVHGESGWVLMMLTTTIDGTSTAVLATL